ncbi:MAG: LCP family protein [Nitriliruptoraceae bacterium]
MAASEPNIWGPVVEGRARRRRRIGLALAVTVPLVAALVVGAALWATSLIDRVDVEGLATAGAPTHVLIVGSDRRDLLTAEEQRELSTGGAEGQRADTIFVLTIDGDRAATLAFPRDLWVRRCDGTEGRINAAVAIGGPSCLVDAIATHAGIRVHHYLEITFGGFRDLVDAVGGVELCLDEAIADRDAGIDLPAGCQRLDGTDALGYVRVRKIDDDLHRIERQKQFVEALAGEVLTWRNLGNPVRAVHIARGAAGAVVADESLGPLDLLTVARGMRALADGSAAGYTVPTTPRTTSAGAAVLDTRHAEADPLFAAFRTGQILRDVATEDDSGIEPADVEVAVYNGAGVTGLATRTAQQLAEAGFTIAAVSNAERQATTRILYPPGTREGAELVAAQLGQRAEFDETSAVTVVTVLLGEDWSGPR